MKKEKKENKAQDKKLIKSKESFGSKILDTIKTRWLITGTNTILLIAILIAIFILINAGIKKLDITPIDCTTNKEYTLTEESKERIKDINQTINIYMCGYDEDETQMKFAKQYNKANSNINVEAIDLTERKDIQQKYNLSTDESGIIVENGERSKIITADELYTYDSSYNTVDLTEEKITSAILTVTSENIPTVYFLEGYTDYKLSYGLSILSMYLEDEVTEAKTLNLFSEEKVPDDCDTLVIASPSKDFDEKVANLIIDYINKGGNILWLNASYSEQLDLPNVNKVLAVYGVNPFGVGYVYETDNSKTALGYSNCIIPEVASSELTEDFTTGLLFLGATKINVNEEALTDLNIVKTDLVTSSEKSYFRKSFSDTSENTDGDEQGSFILGAKFQKTISEGTTDENAEESTEEATDAIKSTLIIYGDINFASDVQISDGVYPMIYIYNNKDLVLNSIADLTEQNQDITIRKDYLATSTYTPTDGEKQNIIKIIFLVPILIIVIGIVIWQSRRRKK